MPLSFSSRAVDLREQMDNPTCDQERLFNTFRQFALVNALVAGWRRVYVRHLRPALPDLSAPIRLLDIGCGGGDVPLSLWQWAQADGFTMEVTAIDTDPRALEYVGTRTWPESFHFRQARLRDLVAEGMRFDIVVSNNLLHHLPPEDVSALLDDVARLAPRQVVFNDIERQAWAYRLFKLGASPFFHGSFVVADGLTSIRRSFTQPELEALAPAGWTVHRQFPFRLLLMWDKRS